MNCFEKVRTPERHDPLKKEIGITAGVLLLGVCLGAFSKFLDYRQAELPPFLSLIDQTLDLHNFLGTFAPWVVLATFLSIKSSSAFRAGLHVFAFFAGMVTSYYLYSNFVAGFFPKSYAMIWVAFTLLSPVLAFFCWYATGKGWFAFAVSAGILGFLIHCTLAYGMWYVDVRSPLHLLMLILGVVMLRKSWKETVGLVAASIPVAILLSVLIPFGI